MKKLVLLFILAGLLFNACSSDSPLVDDPSINSEATLYDVTFDVKDFDVIAS